MISWLNIAKGLGILAVVLGHSHPPLFLYQMFYYFHIPLFFFISGFLHNENIDILKLFIKKIKAYIFIYYTYGLLSLILFTILLWLQNKFIMNNFLNYLQGLIFVKIDYLANSNLWFLPSLFLSLLFSHFLIKFFFNKNIMFTIIIGVLIILSYLIGSYRNSYFMISTIPIGTLFILLGYLFNKKINLKSINKKTLLFISILLGISYYISYFEFNIYMDIGKSKYSNLMMNIYNACIGILFIVVLSYILNKNKFLEFLGKNSLYIFILHQLFVPIIDNIIKHLLFLNNFIFIGSIKILFSLIIYHYLIKKISFLRAM